jgi:hypothetical protein
MSCRKLGEIIFSDTLKGQPPEIIQREAIIRVITSARQVIMRTLIFFLMLTLFTSTGWAESSENEQQVGIADPYIELHTGPGSSYPIFYVIERGEWVTVIKRKTDWFKLRTAKGKEGWAAREQMEQTLSPTGEKVEFVDATQSDFEKRRWEIGATGGQLGEAAQLSIYGGYAFSNNLSGELTVAESLGNISSSLSIKGSLLAQPFPEWRFSPFFSLGTGYMETRPRSTLVAPRDTSNQFSHVGLGLRTHITRRFIFRLEVNEVVIFSASNERDSNEEFTEWKAGFGVFF